MTRPATLALVLLRLAPFVHAAPPPGHAGLGTATVTTGDGDACSDLTLVATLVSYGALGDHQLSWDAAAEDPTLGRPGRGGFNYLAQGSPSTGFTWTLACDTGSLGPLGDATPFENVDTCDGTVVRGTLDFDGPL